jgi:hypothetical protein
LALPAYGLLTFWATFTHEPNRTTEVEAYARYISTTSYLAQHLLGSILGTILAIFGVIALAAYLANSHVGRLALLGMVLSVAGNCLTLTVFGFALRRLRSLPPPRHAPRWTCQRARAADLLVLFLLGPLEQRHQRIPVVGRLDPLARSGFAPKPK